MSNQTDESFHGQRVPDTTPKRVEAAVRKSIDPGMELVTPSRKKPFAVERFDADGVVLLLGQGAWPTRLTWDCLEGTVPFLRQQGGEVPIGGRHDVEGNPGTLDEWLKGCTKTTTAGWVAVVLEKAGIVEIIHDRPARVRLTPAWR